MQNTIVLIGLLVIAIISLIELIVLRFSSATPIVKAGKVEDFEWRCSYSTPLIPSQIIYDGKAYNTVDYVFKIIKGESMKKFGLHDNYWAFMHNMTYEERTRISGEPVLEFSIVYKWYEFWQIIAGSKRKLRKFIAYIPISEKDWHKIYNMYRETIHISISEDDFVGDLTRGRDRLKNVSEMLILSETYDKKKGRDHYSLHPISSLTGRLEFYCPPPMAA